jgi:hypothetical protein
MSAAGGGGGGGGSSSAAPQTCTTTATIKPCPALAPKARNVTLTTAPFAAAAAAGVVGCAASPVRPEDLVDAATLGVGAQAVRVRASATAAWVDASASGGLKAGSYLVQVVYPGGLTAETTAAVRVAVVDKTPPAAAVKAGASSPADGSVCVYARRAGSSSACVTVASLVVATDNCSPAQAVKKSFSACAGCATGGATTASKACVAVGTRAVVRVAGRDRAGNSGTLDVPVVAYKDKASVPAGVVCVAG